MSWRRRTDKPDTPTQTIVDELRKLGYVVCYERSSDLSVRHPTWQVNTWRKLEVKRPANKKGSPRLDSRQKEQAAFCAAHAIPYVTNTEQALAYLRAQ